MLAKQHSQHLLHAVVHSSVHTTQHRRLPLSCMPSSHRSCLQLLGTARQCAALSPQQYVLSVTAEQSVPAAAELPSDWREPLDPMLWHGNETAARKRVPTDMAPPWKVMLLSDGSVTRHLQLLTDLPVQVDCLEMRCVGSSTDGLPPGVETIPGPRTQRQVLLRLPEGSSNRAMVYASSWWDAAHVSEYLTDTSRPIWESLSQGRTELYRDIQQVYCGHSAYLEEKFQAKGPFWGRHYVFWHNGRPLTLIYEVFSTALERYLGTCGSQ